MSAYLDNISTTPIDPMVRDLVFQVMAKPHNPHVSYHPFGAKGAEIIEVARGQVAAAVGAKAGEVFWTPSATAANNLAVQGIAFGRQKKGRHIVTTAIEHPSVLEPCRSLKAAGFEVDYVAPDRFGVVSAKSVLNAVRDDTILVSVMAVNNVIGSIQPVQEIAAGLGKRGPLLHCDAVQAAGKIPLDFLADVDLITLSSHKVYGPLGAAALVVRSKRGILPRPIVVGGGQEEGIWAGTVNVPAVAGFGLAMELASANLEGESSKISALASELERGIKEALPGSFRNGRAGTRVDHIVSMTVQGVSGETLIAALGRAGVAASVGSACSGTGSGPAQPSYALLAIGLTRQQARSTLRFGLGRFTTLDDINAALHVINNLPFISKR